MRKAAHTKGIATPLSLFCFIVASCASPTQTTQPVSTVQVSAVTDTATALGTTVQFRAVVTDGSGNTLNGKAVSWSSTVPAVAIVDPATGLATATANGSTTIRAIVDGVTGARTLVVAQGVVTVTIDPGTCSINGGTTQRFAATAKDGNGNAVLGIKFHWTTSNANVAVVDTTGLATGVGRGAATITAAARGQLDSAVVRVVFPAGRLVVASDSDNAVYLYDAVTLTRLSSFSVMRPLSAAVGPDGRIYAGERAAQIVAINPATSDTATLGAGLLSGYIYGTTVSASGVVYASGSGGEVRTMDLAGASLGIFASGENFRATAFGPDGSFYVTSFSGGPVHRWRAGFVYDTAFGGGGLTGAFGIATRASGEVIVTSQNQGAYFRFSPEGVFLGSVSITCSGQVRNVAADQDDNLWVACYGANAIVKFDKHDREVARFTVHSPSGVAFERP